MLLNIKESIVFYFENYSPEMLFYWRSLNVSLSLSLSVLTVHTDCLSTHRLSPHTGWKHPCAWEVIQDLRRGEDEETSPTHPDTPCRYSGSLFCCFGSCGATPAHSAKKVGACKKKRKKEKKKEEMVSKCLTVFFFFFFVFELHKLARRATTVSPTTSSPFRCLFWLCVLKLISLM